MSIRGGIANALERGHALDCACLQIFTRNARQWQARPLSRDEIKAFARGRRQTRIWPVVAHASYLINLAAREPATRRRSLAALEDDLRRADALHLPGLVVHPGSSRGHAARDGIQRIAESILAILERTSALSIKILLETTAGQGNEVGARFEELAGILALAANRRRMGVCFDTCHAFAAGYDLRTEKAYQKTWAEFDSTIGIRRLHAIHLNDSKGDIGSRLDRHEHIGAGRLGLTPFRLLMQDARLSAIPKMIETPKGRKDDEWDRRNLALLRRLARASAPKQSPPSP